MIAPTKAGNLNSKVGTGVALPSSRGSVSSRRPVVPMNAVKEVFMPALSSTMTEGKIVSWLKSPGDPVKRGEALVVVESGAVIRCCVERWSLALRLMSDVHHCIFF